MMSSSLKERLARLGPSKAADQNRSGSSAILALRPDLDLSKVKTIPAIQSLYKRGMSMLRAKRAVEALVEEGRAVILVPKIESLPALTADLQECGVAMSVLDPDVIGVEASRESV